MNILIPDSWLREFLKTKAMPKEIQRCLSLCGPSVERVRKAGDDFIYDVEITTNRPDAMSVAGVAREAAAILPRFGIAAKLVSDPYTASTAPFISAHKKEGAKRLTIKTDARLNPRWTSMVLTGVRVAPSPAWLRQKLETTGVRSINNVIDITNYLMHAYGQPAHAFDYDEIEGAKMMLRASKKGEKIVTLDGKTHILPGDDIIIEDGAGRIIDLCGIMGGQNSSIKPTTTTVVLFTQTYNPMNIRKTSMAIPARSEASSLFEKGLDSELTLPALIRGIELMEKLTGARIASKLYDIYPKPYKPYSVTVTKEKTYRYIGTMLTDSEIKKMLVPLGFTPSITKKDITVTVPSYRTDVALDVDVIEEIARIWGYHNIPTKLPEGEPPVVISDPQLLWEQEIKVRLRDWGFSELYTYSMISEKLMGVFGLDTKKAYKISNPLSEEWLYMRPTLWPSVLTSIEQNLHAQTDLQVFELSMRYVWQAGDLPKERPVLLVAWTGRRFREAKGLAQAIFALFGLSYHPISKYPPIVEDLSFIVTAGFQVGPLIDVLSRVHKHIESIKFLDAYENKRTFRVTYNDPTKNLTGMDVAPIRQKLIEYAGEKFGASVVTA
ncbi:MAG: phenylalanine--tRNA ligase subunit beta [Candidatus Gottesmanbacteria bacterium]|nr:phenylalanine--tRNA ligase subunit beta [Candidatus Gottesmanbacteria bacterium]